MAGLDLQLFLLWPKRLVTVEELEIFPQNSLRPLWVVVSIDRRNTLIL